MEKSLKHCTWCKVDKEYTEFRHDKSRKGGFSNRCKTCDNLNRLKYPERKGRSTKRYLQMKEKIKALNNEYKKKYPERIKAHGIYRKALKQGLIVKKPCQECGNPKSMGHHEDYSKPLEVWWLCARHHRLWHTHRTFIRPIRGKIPHTS